MSFANRTFRDNKTGEVLKVIDSFENIAILENKSKVSTDFLSNPELYTEEINPLNFFNNQGSYNILADKIKNIPTDFIKDEPGTSGLDISSKISIDGVQPAMNESAIIMMSEEDEKAELARKYGVNPNPVDAVSRQNEAFSRLLGEDADDELPVIKRLPDLIPNDEPVQRIEVNRDPQPVQPVIQQPVAQVEDPIITMFKNVKKSVDFKFNVELSNKIPRLDFIEMMEDSYETSIIEFLANEFTNNILSNPDIIRDSIKERIKQLVYGVEVKPKVNDQITDSVTQIKHEPLTFEKEPVLTKDLEQQIISEIPKKPKTTRKPRAKKESTEK
jgi:hypothetical protein